MKWLRIILVLLAASILMACGSTPTNTVGSNAADTQQHTVSGGFVPTPRPLLPDQNGNYVGGIGINQDLHIYVIQVEVLAPPGSVESFSFQGRSSSSYGRYGGYSSGYISGGTEGKGILRVLIKEVQTVNPYQGSIDYGKEWQSIVKAGDIVILKVVDTKATALAAGDVVSFTCRQQAEFSNAVAGDEIPSQASVVNELDYCRLGGPVITKAVPTPVITNTSVLTDTGANWATGPTPEPIALVNWHE